VNRISPKPCTLWLLLVASLVFSASALKAQPYSVMNIGPTDYRLDNAGSSAYFSAERVYYSDGVVGMQGTYVSASVPLPIVWTQGELNHAASESRSARAWAGVR
jgi:hypothetical protein